MLSAIRLFVGTVLLVLSSLFGYLYYDRYWRWRECFNELGRCWDSDSEQVYLEQAGIIWGGGAAVLLAIALVLLPWGSWRRRR